MIFRIFSLLLSLSISSYGDTALMDCRGFVNSSNLSVQRSRLLVTCGEKIWRKSIQLRRSLTLWKIIHDRLQTETNLPTKIFSIPSCCRLCYPLKKLVSIYSFIAYFVNAIWNCLETVFAYHCLSFEDMQRWYQGTYCLRFSMPHE